MPGQAEFAIKLRVNPDPFLKRGSALVHCQMDEEHRLAGLAVQGLSKGFSDKSIGNPPRK